jgi:hypothetical protein
VACDLEPEIPFRSASPEQMKMMYSGTKVCRVVEWWSFDLGAVTFEFEPDRVPVYLENH